MPTVITQSESQSTALYLHAHYLQLALFAEETQLLQPTPFSSTQE